MNWRSYITGEVLAINDRTLFHFTKGQNLPSSSEAAVGLVVALVVPRWRPSVATKLKLSS